MIDIPKLAEAIVAFLAPHLPRLLAAGEKAAGKAVEKLGEKAGEQAWHWAGLLLQKLRPKAETKPALSEAVNDVAKTPGDADAQATLRQQLKKLLADDASLAGELEHWLNDATAAGVNLLAAGDRSIASQEIKDSIASTGDGATILKVTNLFADATFTHALLRSATPSPDLARALETYLQQCVLDRYRYLDFKGLGVADRVPIKLELLDMFVPLKARIEMPKADTWDRHLQLAGRQLAEADRAALGERLSEPVPLLDLLQKHSGLIVLGDPGAGKTTFLKYLALRHATGQSGESRLPVIVPLSAYANALAERDQRLDDFIASYFHNLGSDLPVDSLLRQALAGGRALVMLDGLDEVTDLNLRETLVRRVEAFFTFHRRAGNKFLITSRIVGYREVRPAADGLAECTLVDFDDTEIGEFVAKWTAALEKAAQGDTAVARQDAEREQRELLDATQRNPGVRRLAANPLLLTVLALMKRQGVTLPERRVELYENYVKTLLSSWNRARGLGRAPARELDVVETVKMLAPLALWMHTVNPGVGLVKKVDLEDELKRLYRERGEAHPEAAARRFLHDVHQYTCLLLERGPGLYGFIHLTFEEYLAAVALAQQGQESVEPVVKTILDRVAEPAWREVILLSVGYLGIVQQRDQAASKVVEGMLAGAAQTQGLSVAVAGEAVADAASGVTAVCRSATVQALLRTLADSSGAPPTTRAEAGNVLARLGDPRLEIVPKSLEDLGAMEFCYVPPGEFFLGEDGPKKQNLDHGFWIARHPVTVAQYAWFVKEGGYRHADFWPEAIQAKCWEDGQFKSRWADYGATGPKDLGFPFDQPNHPIVGVSWYEAMAFARWLSTQWKTRLPNGCSLRLPIEAEWEKAARGGKEILPQPLARRFAEGLSAPERPDLAPNPDPKREYPWLGEFDPNKANGAETQIGATSAVGCFPAGASPCGALDLSGNVWEWCENWYDEKTKQSRVLRGGTFGNATVSLRCCRRIILGPDRRDLTLGFRVVCGAACAR